MKSPIILPLLLVLELLTGGNIAFALPGESVSKPCTVIELHPGYPGYRGYIMELISQPDQVCAEALTAANPSFDKSTTVRKIQDTARRLGVNGIFDDWTWETWMAVDIEMGNIPPVIAVYG